MSTGEKYLFDLGQDPLERNNLIADPLYAEVKAGLRKRLLELGLKAGERFTVM